MINRIVIFTLLMPFLAGCVTSTNSTKYIDLTLGDKILSGLLNSKPDGYTNAIE